MCKSGINRYSVRRQAKQKPSTELADGFFFLYQSNKPNFVSQRKVGVMIISLGQRLLVGSCVRFELALGGVCHVFALLQNERSSKNSCEFLHLLTFHLSSRMSENRHPHENGDPVQTENFICSGFPPSRE